MTAASTVAFERSHNIVIGTPATAVFDYVTNPQSWPEWLAASHHIDSENRPLDTGEVFHEKWHIRSGEVALNWIVRAAIRPKLWIVQAETDFIGPIVVQYTCEEHDGRTTFTRTLRNPARKNFRPTSRSPTWMPKQKSVSRTSSALSSNETNSGARAHHTRFFTSLMLENTIPSARSFV